MAVNLPGGLSGIPTADIGLGPGNDNAAPRWRCTDQSISAGNIVNWINLADQYDFTIIHRVAGNRGDFCNPGPATASSPGGTLVYDESRFRANVEAFAGISAYADAITRRRIISWTVDEPYISVFNGSIPKTAQNKMGLIIKEYWSDALTAQRASFQFLNPPPAGGWTGLDYGISQYDPISPKAGISMAQFFASEKASLLGINLGMIPALNWLNSSDGRLWDYLNTGSSSGRIAGASGAGFWLISPPEIRECADLLWDDPDAIGFVGYQYIHPNFPEQQFRQYQDRPDYVAAFDYLLNKFAARPTFNGFRTPKGITPPPPPGTGDEVEHFASTPTGNTSTLSGTYTDITGATIGSANLTPGKKYLLIATGEIGWNSTTAEGYVRTVAGTTALRRSESAFRTLNTNTKQSYFWWTVYTAVADEDIQMQYRTSDGVSTISANRCQVFALNLADDLIDGVDYRFAESLTLTTLAAGFQDGASITFTPQTAGDDWLILTAAHYTTPPTVGSVVSSLRRAGEAAESDPEVRAEGKDPRDLYRLCTPKVVTLGNSSNTFAEQSKTTGSGGTRDGSAVFALRLNKFARHAFSYDASDLTLSTSSYGSNIGTTSITPSEAGDVWVLAGFGFNVPSVNTGVRARVQLDNADSPSGQTSSNSLLTSSFDPTDVLPVVLSTVGNLSAAAHTVDVDGSVSNVGSGGVVRNRLVMAVSMALVASVGNSIVTRRSACDGLGARAGTRKVR